MLVVFLAVILFALLFAVTTFADSNEAKPLILFQSDDNELQFWWMEGNTRVGSDLLPPIPSGWKVKAFVDANNNGHPDIYLHNQTEGRVMVWLMEGLYRFDTIPITNPAPHRDDIDSAWEMKGVGDLNNSGEPDIIWQHEEGDLAVWLMENQAAYATGRLYNKYIGDAGSVLPSWQIGAIIDLTGDGSPEVLWQAVEGEFLDQLAYWNVDVTGADFYRSGSGRLTEDGQPRQIMANWRMKAAVDLLEDGTPEILFQAIGGDFIGEHAYWEMDQAERIGGARLDPITKGAQWHLVAAAMVHIPEDPTEPPSEHSIDKIVFNPASPATLEFGDYIDFEVEYTTSHSGNVNISGVPLTEGSATPGYYIDFDALDLLPGSGTAAGRFRIRDLGQTEPQVIDQVRFTMWCADNVWDPFVIVIVDVDFTYVPPTEHMIYNIRFTPSSPGTLEFGDYIDFEVDYKNNFPGNVVIWGRALTGGFTTPHSEFVATVSLPPGEGTAVSRFRIEDLGQTEPQIIDQVRFTMWCAETGWDTFAIVTVDVDFTFEPPSEHSIDNIVFDPASPATLEFGERVNYTFDYSTSQSGDVRIVGTPLTAGSISSNIVVNVPFDYPTGQGSGSGFFSITELEQNVDQVRFRMFCRDTNTILLEFFEDVDYTYEPPSEHSIDDIVFDPESPATLEFGEYINFTFDYSTTNAGNVQIFGRPMTQGELSPYYSGHHSPSYSPPTGSGSGFLRIRDVGQTDAQHVDQARFIMVCVDTNTTLLEHFVDVNYTYEPPSEHSINNIDIDPESPATLEFGVGVAHRINATFDYATNHPGNVRVIFAPWSQGSEIPNTSFMHAADLPPGTGSGSAYFEVRDEGQTEAQNIDQVSFWMLCMDTNTLLLEIFQDVDYTYEPPSEHSIDDIVFDPPSPATLEFGDYITFTFEYSTTNPGEVQIFGSPMTQGEFTAGGHLLHSPLYQTGTGSGDSGFRVDYIWLNESLNVDQVNIGMICATTHFILYETTIDVNYTFQLTEPALSNDADLISLPVTNLTPAFDPAITNYTVEHEHTVSGIGVTPTLSDPNASLTINGEPHQSGTIKTIWLNPPGEETIVSIVVTAEDGITTKEYIITVYRKPELPPGFDHDFGHQRDGTEGWKLDGSWEEWSTQLISYGLENKWSSAWYTVNEYRNFEYTVTMRARDRTRPQYIVIRAGEQFAGDGSWHPGYFFGYSHFGINDYSIWRRNTDGTETALANWTATAAIVEGWNTLKVRAENNRFDFYINDTLVETVFDGDFTVGKVGFTMYDNEGWLHVGRATLTVLDD